MRIVIFGANGPTGRLLTRLSLDAGYDTVAVTRQPGTFGVQGPRLRPPAWNCPGLPVRGARRHTGLTLATLARLARNLRLRRPVLLILPAASHAPGLG
jgi:hypothetical protein